MVLQTAKQPTQIQPRFHGGKPQIAFNPVPSVQRSANITIGVSKSIPTDADCVGIPVSTDGTLPREPGIDRERMAASGFEAKPGQALVLPRSEGPTLIVFGIGNLAELDSATLRDAAAAFARAAGKHTRLAIMLSNSKLPPEIAAQVAVEGVLLAAYRYDALKRVPAATDLRAITVVTSAEREPGMKKGAERGRIFARAALLARDLANTPPAHLTAGRMVEVANTVAAESAFTTEVFDAEALEDLGCGGLLGVNRGSVEPPYMIKMTYAPRNGRAAAGRLTLVGKGVMYDSGGISLKPSDASHATMKLDMSGSAAVLAAMSALAALECTTEVTAYLVCTDNMPSGSALKLGDVLTIHGGKTVEVLNTDAEGRLIIADAMVLAAEKKPDAIVTIATLTGACLRALGRDLAGVLGNRQELVDQVFAAGRRTGEGVWQFPLHEPYRKELESEIADLKNIGGENAGTITAGLFLSEFVGDVPWAHIDIAGTANAETDDSWRSKGGTGFGTRLLTDLALNFKPLKAA